MIFGHSEVALLANIWLGLVPATNRLWRFSRRFASLPPRGRLWLTYRLSRVDIVVAVVRYHLQHQFGVVPEEAHALLPPSILLLFVVLQTNNSWLTGNLLYASIWINCLITVALGVKDCLTDI